MYNKGVGEIESRGLKSASYVEKGEKVLSSGANSNHATIFIMTGEYENRGDAVTLMR